MSNSSCTKEKLEALKTVDFNQDFELALNDSIVLSKSEKELGIILEAVSDSRCPSDVQCVWAGNAVIKVRLRSASGSMESRELCIGACNVNTNLSDAANVTLDGTNYVIKLKEVRPYPKQNGNVGIKKSALLTVSK